MLREIDISVCVLTYNPKWNKLIETIDSILIQEDINYEIVISDDGSKEFFFDELVEYFKSKNFENYKLVPAKENQGTVLNVKKAIDNSKGVYIKLISPGDMLYKSDALFRWCKALKDSRSKWSFAKAIFYNDEAGVRKAIAAKACPQIIETYLSGDEKKSRWNSVVNMDLVLGAAIICDKELMSKYINRIAGKVIFAEDNIYRMMLFDGEMPCFYCENTILYEYGSGISTSANAVWAKRLLKDLAAANNELAVAEKDYDAYQLKMLKAAAIIARQGGLFVKLNKCFVPGFLKLAFMDLIKYRKTDIVENI